MTSPAPPQTIKSLPEEILTEILTIYTIHHRTDHSLPIIPLLTSNKQISAITSTLLYSEVHINHNSILNFLELITIPTLKKIQHLVFDLPSDYSNDVAWAMHSCKYRFKQQGSELILLEKLSFTGYLMSFGFVKMIQEVIVGKQIKYNFKISSILTATSTMSIIKSTSIKNISFVGSLTTIAYHPNLPNSITETLTIHLVPTQAQPPPTQLTSSEKDVLTSLDNLFVLNQIGKLVLDVGYLTQVEADRVIAWGKGKEERVQVVCTRDPAVVVSWINPITNALLYNFNAYPHAALPIVYNSDDEEEDNDEASESTSPTASPLPKATPTSRSGNLNGVARFNRTLRIGTN